MTAGEAGRIKRLPVAVGDCLVKGQVVAELEDETLLARDRQARHDLEQARGLVRALDSELEPLRQEAGAATDRQAMSAREDALRQAKIREGQAQACLDRLETALLAHMIVSPVNGVMAKLPVAVGEDLAVGAPVADIVDLDSLHFTGNLPTAPASWVRVGLPGDVRLAARPHQVLPAVVVALDREPARPGAARVTMTFAGELARCLPAGEAASALIVRP